MIDIKDITRRVILLMFQSEDCISKAISNKNFLLYFSHDSMAQFIVKEAFAWKVQYSTVPSMRAVYEKYKNDANQAASIKVFFSDVKSLEKTAEPPKESEFDYYVNQLKIYWSQHEFIRIMEEHSKIGSSDFQNPEGLSDSIKNLSHNLVEVTNKIALNKEGDYSYTTENADENLDFLANRDLSTMKRFEVGHRVFDMHTHGLRYGEFMLILGYINQGKSMVVANLAFNLWNQGANVFLLTSEMQPMEFDERVYSRISQVSYDHILNGKQYITKEDLEAFEACKKMIKSKKNHIITKYLKPTDNLNTIDQYIKDLELSHGFVPDILIVDSIQHISAAERVVEEKDFFILGKVADEFKSYANTFKNGRGLVAISTFQAKTETHGKKFKDISITDFGRSKIVPEKADFAFYIRTQKDLNTMNVKLIKARRCPVGTEWAMAIDFSKVLIANPSNDSLNSGSDLIIDDRDND
jgi:archaellum biogenesis ATPase FlaH